MVQNPKMRLFLKFRNMRKAFVYIPEEFHTIWPKFLFFGKVDYTPLKQVRDINPNAIYIFRLTSLYYTIVLLQNNL